MASAGLLGAFGLTAALFACVRLSPRRFLFCLAGFLIGGALGALPGACFLFPALAANSAEPFPFHWIVPGLLFAVGGTLGALAGLVALDRATSPARPRPWAWAAAGAGMVTGVLFGVLALVLTTDASAWNGVCLILGPVGTVAATLAGYALRVAPPQ